MDQQEAISRLNETHQFPTDFLFKVIGNVEGTFEKEVREVCESYGGAKQWSSRDSKGGRHRALSIMLNVKNAEEVLELWAKFRACNGTHMLL